MPILQAFAARRDLCERLVVQVDEGAAHVVDQLLGHPDPNVSGCEDPRGSSLRWAYVSQSSHTPVAGSCMKHDVHIAGSGSAGRTDHDPPPPRAQFTGRTTCRYPPSSSLMSTRPRLKYARIRSPGPGDTAM